MYSQQGNGKWNDDGARNKNMNPFPKYWVIYPQIQVAWSINDSWEIFTITSAFPNVKQIDQNFALARKKSICHHHLFCPKITPITDFQLSYHPSVHFYIMTHSFLTCLYISTINWLPVNRGFITDLLLSWLLHISPWLELRKLHLSSTYSWKCSFIYFSLPCEHCLLWSYQYLLILLLS